MKRSPLIGTLHGAMGVLALLQMSLPAAGLAQEGSGGPAKDVQPSFAEVVAPRPDVPGIAPGKPRKLTGMWEIERFIFLIPNAPMLPATKALYDKQVAAMNGGQILYTAWTSCRPGAPSAMVMPMNSLAVIEDKDDITLSFEEPRMTRRIRLDAQHPADLAPSYMGDSIGHWEGDTLVIDTIGFNGQFQLDSFGLPTGTRLHTVERLTKSADGKKVSVQTTFEDPEYYSAPFTIERAWIPHADGHQFEYDCSENPREEEFAHTYFVKDLYRPTCIRYEGKGLDPSRILCRRREDDADHDQQ
jgi:hypothetical protein